MRHPRILLLALIAATFALGLLDYVTGPRLSFSLCYVAPVTVASWLLGARSGWVLTAAASLAQLSADFAWGAQEVSLITLWNGFTRISVLGALGHMVAWLRRERDRLDQLLAEQTSAHVATVDQLRHRHARSGATSRAPAASATTDRAAESRLCAARGLGAPLGPLPRRGGCSCGRDLLQRLSAIRSADCADPGRTVHRQLGQTTAGLVWQPTGLRCVYSHCLGGRVRDDAFTDSATAMRARRRDTSVS